MAGEFAADETDPAVISFLSALQLNQTIIITKAIIMAIPMTQLVTGSRRCQSRFLFPTKREEQSIHGHNGNYLCDLVRRNL